MTTKPWNDVAAKLASHRFEVELHTVKSAVLLGATRPRDGMSIQIRYSEQSGRALRVAITHPGIRGEVALRNVRPDSLQGLLTMVVCGCMECLKELRGWVA